jgi:hypothetical protein
MVPLGAHGALNEALDLFQVPQLAEAPVQDPVREDLEVARERIQITPEVVRGVVILEVQPLITVLILKAVEAVPIIPVQTKSIYKV